MTTRKLEETLYKKLFTDVLDHRTEIESRIPDNSNWLDFEKNWHKFIGDSDFTDDEMTLIVWLAINREWGKGNEAGRRE